MNKKRQDFLFIKGFSKVTIRAICKELKIDYSNVMNYRTSAENINKVKECICMKLYFLLDDKNRGE